MTRQAPPQIVPPKYEIADAYSMQALARGEANADQQKRALDWIIHRAAKTYDMTFSPDDPHLTSFGEGRRYVGSQIIKMTIRDTKKLAQQQKDS